MKHCGVGLVLVLVPLLLPAADLDATISVVNGTFDKGLDGWTWRVMKPGSQVGVEERDGNCFLRAVGEPGSRVKVVQRVALEPEKWYRVEFRYMAILTLSRCMHTSGVL